MQYMLGCCSSLISLNLSSFDTSKVTDMRNMFYSCLSLIFLNLSSFNTSKVSEMSHMFYKCSLLTSLDVSSFNTLQVTTMKYMFQDCSSLISLNLSNFITTKVNSMVYMFSGCKNLEYINLKNFKTNYISFSKMFEEVPENIVAFINETKILPKITAKKCYTSYCLDDWKSHQKKMIDGSNKCLDSCEQETIYKYEYRGKYYNTPQNYETEKYQTSSFEEVEKTESDIIENSYITEIPTKIKHTIIYDINIPDLTQIIHEEITSTKEKDEIELYNLFLNEIEKIFTSVNYNTTKLDTGENEFFILDNILITLTTTKNQKNIINNILTTIYLEECEDELRGHYKISKNETLYMKKIDITQEKMRIPKIEYDIYSKLNGSNLIKLNISICKNNNIILSIPCEYIRKY